MGHGRLTNTSSLTRALGGEDVEPARHLAAVLVHGGAGEVDAVEGPRVRREDPGHRRGDGARGGGAHGVRPSRAAVRKQVAVDKGEGRREPDGAPARGERSGARAVLDGEARDDVAEDIVRQAADAVDALVEPQGGGGRGSGGGGDGRAREVVVYQVEHEVGSQVQRPGIQAVALYAGLHIAQVVADDRLRFHFHGRRWRGVQGSGRRRGFWIGN
jgi:hypothetical protein